MADLQAALSEAVKLNRNIAQFLKFSTYTGVRIIEWDS